MKKTKNICILIGINIILLMIIIIIPTLIINIKKQKIEKNSMYEKYFKFENKNIYSLMDIISFYNSINDSDKYIIEINDGKNISYENCIKVKFLIQDDSFENNKYKIILNQSEKYLSNNEQEFEMNIYDEGVLNINVQLYKMDEKIKEVNKNIYYIKPYKDQYLDSIAQSGVVCHYYRYEEYDKSENLLKNLGAKYIRADFSKKIINNQENTYNYSSYDFWIEDLYKNSDIKILALVDGINYVDSDNKISSVKKFYENITIRYPKIKDYEILNEENYSYRTKDGIEWYSKLVKGINEVNNNNNNNNNIYIGGVATGTSTELWIDPLEFYKIYYEYDMKSYNMSFHIYNNSLSKKMKQFVDLYNSNGGFNYINVTEYGSTTNMSNEDKQAIDVIKQSVLLEEYCNIKILYNLWATSEDDTWSGQYGILRNDYTPRPAYYSMKNYYENTNGAEYIGHFALSDGITAHVYDKDGKPKMIIWADDNNAQISIDYTDFKAYDLYGKEIENTDGKLIVSSSPIYLNDISENCYFKAINNLAVNKYNEFLKNNGTYLNNDIKNQINSNITFLNSLLNKEDIDENIALSEIEKHFEIGNELIEMYNNGQLNVEYVKLSSMLDSLNDIGNSYEDLVTISAKTRMNDLSNIEEQVNKAKELVNFNEKIEIIYPNKIYKFSQDLYDKASYILGLEEENDIKTGLINSKALHAYYLAKWSQEFSNIYIKDALKEPINEIINANENIKNSNMDIYKNKNVLNDYNSIISTLQDMENDSGKITKYFLVDIYEKQLGLINDICNIDNIDLSNNKNIDLIASIINLTEQYKELYSYYVDKDDISNKTVQNKLNTLIEKYNRNSDLNISFIEKFITSEKKIYENNLQTDSISNNYLNKQRIIKVSEILTKIIDTKVQNVVSEEKIKLQLYASRDITAITNQDITITLRHGDKTKIINNKGKNTYTFTENGTFKFEVSIRNEVYEVPITISCIDKVAPVIEGVKEGQVYYQDVIPTSKDVDIKVVNLYCDNKLVQNYRIGANINTPGKYKLELIDKASNKSSVTFEIRKTISQSDIKQYVMKDNLITGIIPGTTKDEFVNNSGLANSTKVYRSNTEVSKTDIIKTGDTINLNGNTYILVVKGDLTGSGTVGIMDIMQTKRSITSGTDLEEVKKEAADVNGDGLINIMDVMMLIRLTANS